MGYLLTSTEKLGQEELGMLKMHLITATAREAILGNLRRWKVKQVVEVQ